MSDVVGSASFELRATREKIPADMEAARQEILASTKKTEADLAGLIGTGTTEGNKKAAASFEAPKAAASDASNAIKASMQSAGTEIGAAVAAGSAKAKQELDSLAAKAREVQQIKLAQPTIPTEATHRLDTNPVNGVQSWVPKDVGGAIPNIAAPEVKRTADEVKSLTDNLDSIKPAADGAAGGLGGVSKGALLTTASIGALIGAAVLVTKTAYDLGRAAMQSADEIASTATKIGISTDALQEWRHVATQTGADAGAADQALSSFADKLAAAGTGLSKEATKDFAALRITPEQIKSFKSTEEALDEVIDRISALKSESDRAAIAQRLGLGPLVVAVRGGADEIARLRDEAHALGVVMDADLIKRGADAQQQFDTLSRVIGVQLKSAFIDLAPAIVAAISLVAQLATALGDAMDQWRILENKTTRGMVREVTDINKQQSELIDTYGLPQQMGSQRITVVPRAGDQYTDARPAGTGFGMGFSGIMGNLTGNPRQSVLVSELYANNNRRVNAAFEAVQERSTANAPPAPTNRPGGTGLVIPPGPTRVDRSAEQEARRAERVEAEIARARIRVLGIADEEVMTVQERFDMAKKQVEAERRAEATELKSRLAREDITKTEYANLTALNKEVAIREDRVATDILARDLADERLAQERVLTDLTADLLSLQSGAARTAKERREIELRLLEMAQQRAREDLLKSDEYRKMSPDQKAAAVAEQDQVFGWQVNGVNRSTMSPLEQWRDESLRTADEISEAYESVAARGLDSLNDGIVDAIMNSRSLGDVFHNVAQGILADLLKISVRRGITEPLANLLFPGGSGANSSHQSVGGGIAGIFSSFFKGKIPGFSSGVTNFEGGLAYVHQGEVLANLPAGTDVISAAAVSGMRDGGRQQIEVRVTSDDPKFRAYVLKTAGPAIRNAGLEAYGRATSDAAKQAPSAMGRAQAERG